jgi:hypothetical protein
MNSCCLHVAAYRTRTTCYWVGHQLMWLSGTSTCRVRTTGSPISSLGGEQYVEKGGQKLYLPASDTRRNELRLYINKLVYGPCWQRTVVNATLLFNAIAKLHYLLIRTRFAKFIYRTARARLSTNQSRRPVHLRQMDVPLSQAGGC